MKQFNVGLKPYRKKRVKRTRNTTTLKTVKAICKKVVNNNIEVKMVKKKIEGGLLTNINYGGSWSAVGIGIIPISPYNGMLEIAQGVQHHQRVGNEIRIKKAYIKFLFFPRAYDAETNANPKPIDIQLIFAKSKTQANATISLTGFFQDNNTDENFDGNLTDLCKTVNEDKFTVLGTKIYKLGTAGYAGTGSIGSVDQQYYENNDYKYNVIRKLDVTKYLNKVYRFNDTELTPWQNPTFIVVNAVDANGGNSPGNDYRAIAHWHLYIEYTDA